jgi:hypothetical protein
MGVVPNTSTVTWRFLSQDLRGLARKDWHDIRREGLAQLAAKKKTARK